MIKCKSAFVGGMKLKISELGKVITGNTPSKKIKEFWDKDDVGFVKPDIISDEHIVKIKNEDCNEFISNAAINKARIVPKNSIFVTCIGNIGKIGVATENLAFNQQINAITPNENVNLDYLCYAIFANKTRLQDIANAPIVPLLNKSQFSEFELEFDMDINTQTRIVHELNTVSNIILKYKQELLLLDELVKARFVEMFGTLHDNENRFNIVTIEEVCSIIKDGTHQTPRYTEDKINGYKFLSSKDVMSQKIDWKNIKYIPKDLHEKLYASIQPQRNDILMSKNGVNYGVAAVNDTDEVFDIYVSLALLRPKQLIDPVFFRCVINSIETKRQFDMSIKGIGVPNLHLGEIKKTKIILPPMELQKQFVTFVKQIDKSRLLNICLKSLVESVLKIRIFSEYKKSS